MLLLTLLLIVLQVNAQRTYALLAGVSNYNDTEVNLANTTKDVKEMQSVWKQQGAVVATITSKYATPENIMKKLDAIVKLAKAEDISEDEVKDLEDEIQKLTDKYIGEIDKAVEVKSKEVLTV